MFQDPTTTTAILLATFGLLLGVSVLFSRAAERLGVPVVLVFLVLGMLAGSEGIGGLAFDNYGFAFRVGTMALVLILFDGGLNTSYSTVRRAAAPAGVLATIGVGGTAGLVALGARLMGFDWTHSLLIGAIVSSTDAAAVFAVLRGSSIHLKEDVRTTLELESGINDPMAVILTTTIIQATLAHGTIGWDLLWQVPVQLLVGSLAGAATGYLGLAILRKPRLSTGGLYPVLTLALAFVAFGTATLLYGSGFLAVYAAGLVLGNGAMPYQVGTRRVHDAIAWLSQISMFLMMGLLVFPSQLLHVAWSGLGLGLFLAVVARPVVVLLCLLPFRYPWRELVYMCWVGLRGAVPIILATFPVLAGVDSASTIFNVVFFIVVLNTLIPGATIRWATRRLGLETPEVPTPAAVIEINSTQILRGEIMSFYIDDTLAVCGVKLAQIRFPPDAAAILIVRGRELIACRGDTELQSGDHVYIFCRPEDRPYIQLLFGRPEGESGSS